MEEIMLREEKGFTLVELAIVLTIVGLLIGGILKGQQLIMNARVTATVAQIKAIEAATTSFRDAYGGLPGDLKNTNIKINGCGACTDVVTNGSVGEPNWDMTTYQAGSGGTAVTVCDAALTPSVCTGGNEVGIFWYSLEKSGLLSSVKKDAINSIYLTTGKKAFGKSVPKAKIGGGFWVGNSLKATAGRPAAAGNFTLFGTVITLVAHPSNNLNFALKKGPVTPDIAANIDRKIDDGLPDIGSVQAYGSDIVGTPNNTSCYGTGAPYAYQENATTSDCGLHIRIQQ